MYLNLKSTSITYTDNLSEINFFSKRNGAILSCFRNRVVGIGYRLGAASSIAMLRDGLLCPKLVITTH